MSRKSVRLIDARYLDRQENEIILRDDHSSNRSMRFQVSSFGIQVFLWYVFRIRIRMLL